MPDGSGWEFSRTTDQNFYGIPAVALGMWCPWLVGAAKWNAQVQEGFGTVASEWQNFVSRRLKEDFAFMQRVAQCRTPDQMWAAHADFWRNAMEDYSKEYMLMGRLAAGVTSKAAAAGHQHVTIPARPLCHKVVGSNLIDLRAMVGRRVKPEPFGHFSA